MTGVQTCALPIWIELIHEEKIKYEDITDFINIVFDLWDNGLKSIFHKQMITLKREAYETMLRQRLVTFSREDILSSIKNRINFMFNSDWFRDNEQMARSIEPILKDDISLLKWLNSKGEEPVKPKAFIREKGNDLIK